MDRRAGVFGRVFFFLAVTVLLFSASACEKERMGAPIPSHTFQFPTGIAIHPKGFALVASSNFDLTYQSGSLRVIDLNQLASRISTPGYDPNADNVDLILDESPISLDNFAGEVAIYSSGDSSRDFAAVAIRETDQLVLVDLTFGTKVISTGATVTTLELSCSSSSRNIIQLDQSALQFDPFGVVLVDQQSSNDTSAYVSFLRSGTISEVDIPDRADHSRPITLSLRAATGELGINDLAYSSKYIYLSSRGTTTTTITNKIFSFDTESLNLTSMDLYPLLLGTETRGLAFTDDGSMLAVVVLNPNMLVFFDTSKDADGKPKNAYLGSVALAKNPALVRQHNDLFFVTCEQEDTVYIIDGKDKRLLQVRDDRDVCNGPFDVGFFDSSNIHWALFTCFENDTVTVLDLDSTKPDTYLHWIARVGKPRG